MNEADTCRTYVVPKLQAAGWGNAPFSIAEQRCFTNPKGRVRVVGAIENRARGLGEQLAEDRFDRREIDVKVEMLFLDIQDKRVLGMKELKRAIALVAFRHEIFAACNGAQRVNQVQAARAPLECSHTLPPPLPGLSALHFPIRSA